jgi:hypothetical protein
MLEFLWVLIPIVIGVGIFLVYWFYLRKKDEEQGWDCLEGGCEKMLGGKYKTYDQCKNRCADKKGEDGYGSCSSTRESLIEDTSTKKVRFQDEDDVTRVEHL